MNNSLLKYGLYKYLIKIKSKSHTNIYMDISSIYYKRIYTTIRKFLYAILYKEIPTKQKICNIQIPRLFRNI